MAFRTAARIGFRAAAEKADLVLLEPIATLDDRRSRRVRRRGHGRHQLDPRPRARHGRARDGVQVIQRPGALRRGRPLLAASCARSRSGTGSYTIEIDEYEQVPGDMQKKLVEQYQKERAEGH